MNFLKLMYANLKLLLSGTKSFLPSILLGAGAGAMMAATGYYTVKLIPEWWGSLVYFAIIYLQFMIIFIVVKSVIDYRKQNKS